MAGNPRNGRPYRTLCASVKRLGDPCWLCGHNIDSSLPVTHRMSFTLDHVVPLSRGGSLLDPANARSAHRMCNSRRGNRTSAPPLKTTRRW